MYNYALKHFKKVDPKLYKLALTIDQFELVAHSHPFLRLCDAIISQQLSVKASDTILGRFLKLFPSDLPTPEYLLTIPDDNIRQAGISYPKIKYLKDLSEKVIKKEVELEKLSDLPEETVIEELVKVKGIGHWTAEMYLMFTLARPDVFSLGDLGLKNAMIKTYNLSSKPTEEKLLSISQKWAPFRTYACIILWRSLKNQP